MHYQTSITHEKEKKKCYMHRNTKTQIENNREEETKLRASYNCITIVFKTYDGNRCGIRNISKYGQLLFNRQTESKKWTVLKIKMRVSPCHSQKLTKMVCLKDKS